MSRNKGGALRWLSFGLVSWRRCCENGKIWCHCGWWGGRSCLLSCRWFLLCSDSWFKPATPRHVPATPIVHADYFSASEKTSSDVSWRSCYSNFAVLWWLLITWGSMGQWLRTVAPQQQDCKFPVPRGPEVRSGGGVSQCLILCHLEWFIY